MRRILSGGRLLVTAALLAGAVFLIACDRTAELIPGEATPTPSPTETPAPSVSATPIVVNPATGASGGERTGEVIPDHELALSIVQVTAVDASTGFEQIVRYGSGVVVDADERLIATALPVVNPHQANGAAAYTSIVIAVDRAPGTPPQREFLAEVVAADPQADLAILRVVSDLQGQPVTAEAFDLPAVTRGDATAAGLGFSLRVFGYPGAPAGVAATDQVVETAQATIVGQRGAAGRTGRTWFKMDARMPFGAAGGPAFDRFGALIGILAQDAYVPAGAVGQVRPIDLLLPLIEEARTAEAAWDAPLYRTATLPGSLQPPPNTGIYVARPAFAENATESRDSLDLFDYETRFASGLGALYYEYEVNGAPDGAVIEERWFLDGVQQESLSSSFVWSRGPFGLVTDRITAPSPAGIPSGQWRLDVYVDGVLHSTATAVLGVSLGTPSALFQFGASAATAEGNIQAGAFSGAAQLLMMFDVSGMTGANEVEWQVYRDNVRVYVSPAVPWIFGPSGRFWVGYRPEGGIGPGVWEFELHVNGTIVEVGSLTLF